MICDNGSLNLDDIRDLKDDVTGLKIRWNERTRIIHRFSGLLIRENTLDDWSNQTERSSQSSRTRSNDFIHGGSFLDDLNRLVMAGCLPSR